MTPTTLTGEYHVSEVVCLDWHPVGLGECYCDPETAQAAVDDYDESDWPSVIAYAERHAAEVEA